MKPAHGLAKQLEEGRRIAIHDPTKGLAAGIDGVSPAWSVPAGRIRPEVHSAPNSRATRSGLEATNGLIA